MTLGDIVVVEFPFTNLSQTKVRPAVVVATTNDRYKDIVVCLISSVLPDVLLKGELLLQTTEMNNLRVTSVIKVYRIATIEQQKIITVIGRLSLQEKEQFRVAFQSLVNQS